MARTEAPPAAPVAAPPAPPPPASADAGRPSPVLAWPSEWPVPVLPEQPQRRSRAGRGMPMAPALAASGNATSLTLTGAYQLGGPIAVAVTGTAIVAGATATVVRRRATVRRTTTVRAGRGGATSGWQSLGGATPGLGATGRRRSSGGGGGSRSGSGSGSTRHGATGETSGGRHAAPDSGKPGDSRSKKNNSGGATPTDSTATRDRKRSSTPKSGQDWGVKSAARRAARAAARRASADGSLPRRGLAALGKNAVTHPDSATGRLRSAAWRAARRRGDQLHTASQRKLKALRGAARDGIRALAAGAWAGLKRWDRKAAVGRLKAVWARHRATRHATTAAATAASTTAPTIGATVRRPVSTTTATAGGTAMSGGHHFVAPAMELARIAANYDPKGMLQVGEDFAGLEEALRLHAEAMKVTVDNADAKQPLDPRIIEIMRQVHQLQIKAAELAGELPGAFEKLHDVDLSRLRNPRKGVQGERMWDVASNL